MNERTTRFGALRKSIVTSSAVIASAIMIGAALSGPTAALAAPAQPVTSAASAAVPTASTATAITLLPRGSQWRWRYAAGAWPTGWQSTSFADSAWKSGAAPLGWGSGTRTAVTPEGTPASKPLSIQFRSKFTIPTDKVISDVRLSFRADDGAVIYVNGIEISRVNLPSGGLSANSYATAAPNAATAAQLHTVTIPASALRSGTNTIAASTHLNWRATPTVSFDAEVVAKATTTTAPAPAPTLEGKPAPITTSKPAPAPAPGAGDVCGAQGYLAPDCGALWGAYTIKGDTLTTAITGLEQRVGRQFDITLRYHDFSTSAHQGLFPDSHEQTLGQNRTLLFAWQARVAGTNTDIKWASIARGEWDSYIDSAATRVKAFGKPVMIAFDPEFDRFDKGTMAEYIAAYKRVHDRFAAKGVSNVAWLWVSTGYIGAGNDKKIAAGYPGDAYVDWVGFDPYNFYTCNGSNWTTFENEVKGPHDFLVNSGWGDKPQILMEYGTEFDEANPARSTQFYKDIPSVLKKFPNIKALVRFDAGSGTSSCDMRIDNGAGMVDAFAKAGLDPWVNTR